MNNVFCVAWRVPRLGLCPSSLLTSTPVLRSAYRVSTTIWPPHSTPSRCLSSLILYNVSTDPRQSLTGTKRYLLSTPGRLFTASSRLGAESNPPVEHGIQVRPQPFSAAEISAIFGSPVISPEMGNRALAVLQERRVNGTLDLDLPVDISLSVHTAVLDAGLKWLRENHPLDEDAAILARIEREGKEEQEKLVRRAEQLGLYKPQSGTYGAELGDSNDPYGRSVLKEAREQNEARLLAEQERKRQEWLEGGEEEREQMKRSIQKNTALEKFDESAALEVRERADPTQRPVLAWVQKHHLRATEWEVDLSRVTNTSRIVRALAAVLVTTGLSYLFAEYYQPPAKADRMWPDIPPAAATVIAIIGVNLGIFVLWKFPPAWRLLNRYFITSVAYPRPLSLVGSVFSHQSLTHMTLNMLGLWLIGTKVHDEIGRGNFLALYLTSGVFGSFTSLVFHILRGNLMLTGLGASSAISGLVAALCMLHSDDRMSIFFLPDEWKEAFSARGSVFLAAIVGFEFLSVLAPQIAPRIDSVAHLGGYLVGYLWSLAYKQKEKERHKKMSWLDRLFRGE